MGCGSSIECSSPRCQEAKGSRCYKHSHNYSWWCKYCKQEEDNYFKENDQRRSENERRLKQYEQERLQKEIAEKERYIREYKEIIREKERWLNKRI
ncbi:unnamed protein product [Paramecium sonneborni]|uniref:Uncharacterized protein n=1 Tax=Paramecium sonneborni TaxID=65129 RepID=A0A8S1QSH4_9CILI|nr:unnamed protein product [Paramecium sonneborni]